MSSSDGFCSTIAFSSGELGQIYTGTVPTAHSHNHMATPVHASPRPSPVALVSSGHKRGSASGSSLAQVPTSNARPTSPSKSRSNSVSSIATQASHVPSASAPVGNSPTPTLGVVPSLAAAHSGPVGIPMNTPPMTPASAASITGSMAGSVLGKRDAGGLSESDQDDGRNAVKKRRIAPTLMDSSGGSR
jgi:chromatin assembly factor 1 subunit B